MKKNEALKIGIITGAIIFLLAGVLAAKEAISCVKELKKSDSIMQDYKITQDCLTKVKKVL